jgi:hypothetical protein
MAFAAVLPHCKVAAWTIYTMVSLASSAALARGGASAGGGGAVAVIALSSNGHRDGAQMSTGAAAFFLMCALASCHFCTVQNTVKSGDVQQGAQKSDDTLLAFRSRLRALLLAPRHFDGSTVLLNLRRYMQCLSGNVDG